MFIVEYFKENQYNAFSEPLIAFKNTKNNHFYYYFFKSIIEEIIISIKVR